MLSRDKRRYRSRHAGLDPVPARWHGAVVCWYRFGVMSFSLPLTHHTSRFQRRRAFQALCILQRQYRRVSSQADTADINPSKKAPVSRGQMMLAMSCSSE